MPIPFTFPGGHGHSVPLVPIARAAQQAGHTVALAGQRAMLSTVEVAGLASFDTGGATVGDVPKGVPLSKLDPEREDCVFRDSYAGRIARERARRILGCAPVWRPDLLVRYELDFGAAVAAEGLGLRTRPCWSSPPAPSGA